MVDYVILVNAHILGPEQIPYGLDFDNDNRVLSIIQDGGKPAVSIPDKDTWRDVVDNLTSTDTDKSLSAYQGKVLDEKIKNNKSEIERAHDRIDKLPFSEYVKKTTLDATLENYDTIKDVDEKLTNYQPKGDYATKTDVTNTLKGYQPKGDYPTRSDVSNNLKEYVTKADLAAKLGDDTGDITFVTDSNLNEKLQDYQPKGDYATNSSVDNKLLNYQPKGDYQPKGNYAASKHTHDWSDIVSGKPKLTLIAEKSVTLSAASWSGTNAPFSYDLGSTYANKAVVVGFNGTSGTVAQLTAAASANIQGGTGTTIYAFGDKPTVDIPIIIQVYEESVQL